MSVGILSGIMGIKSCGLVNYLYDRAIVKIKMVLKVVFGTFRPIVNRIAQVGLGPNCFQALGSSPGLLQSPMLLIGGPSSPTGTAAAECPGEEEPPAWEAPAAQSFQRAPSPQGRE